MSCSFETIPEEFDEEDMWPFFMLELFHEREIHRLARNFQEEEKIQGRFMTKRDQYNKESAGKDG